MAELIDGRVRRVPGLLVLLTLLLLAMPAVSTPAQGPAPVGIRSVAGQPSHQVAVNGARMRRRASPTGKGALIGTIVGLGYGYWATRSSKRWGNDGIDPLLGTIYMGFVGMGVGALLGYVWGQD